MHADEIEIDEALVARLLRSQFPQLANLPISLLQSSGTDHVICRLGDNLSVRLPRRPSAALQTDKEQTWLPQLAPHLPLPIPAALASGKPAEGYPWRWSILPWLPGQTPSREEADSPDCAAELARFVSALHAIDAAGGPAVGSHNFGRGAPLAMRDRSTRSALETLSDEIDFNKAMSIWEVGLEAPPWISAPVWIHGDLSASNILFSKGRLSGILDFGGLGVGDPACDLAIAWSLFSGEAREIYRDGVRLDGAAWRRGRAWALSIAAIQLPYYRGFNFGIEVSARTTIVQVLSDST